MLIKQPIWSALSFQQANRVFIEQATYFHDLTLTIITLILLIIGWVIIDLIRLKRPFSRLTDYSSLEVLWTIIPAVVLVILALPSLRLLYIIDEVDTPDLSINVLGHQWFWEYNYPDFNGLRFESYIVTSPKLFNTRLIETDNRVVMPYNSLIRILISSSDVLHSWTIPSMGVKADAVPGRLNQLSLSSWSTGLFYGQCSEICGANHRFIPIVLEVISPKRFLSWVGLW